VLAYSSISQIGFVATVLRTALAAGDGGAAAPVAFYAACHVLVKGSLFLAIGAAASVRPPGGRCCCRRRCWG
jgi:formate hydrogenlyase subunit 3/multisubunit Na+/H+ antiporter MnhD subunit